MGGGIMTRQNVSVLSTCLITPLGLGTAETFEALEAGISGLRKIQNSQNPDSDGCYSLFSQDQWELLDADLPDEGEFTQFETLLLAAAKGAIIEANFNHKSAKTLFIVASEHGNSTSEGVSRSSEQRFSLEYAASGLCRYFENTTPPVLISCGSLSGLQAIIRGQEELETGCYDHVIVVVSDIVSRSLVSYMATNDDKPLSHCHLHCRSKEGKSRGEAAVAIVLCRHNGKGISLSVGCSSQTELPDEFAGLNSNHLPTAAGQALWSAQLTASEVDVVVHSADAANPADELALSALAKAGVIGRPTLCLNGYFGHTMGVSGILDIGIGIQMLINNTLIESLDFRESDAPFQVAIQPDKKPDKLKICMKAAVDFAGVNVAFVLSRS